MEYVGLLYGKWIKTLENMGINSFLPYLSRRTIPRFDPLLIFELPYVQLYKLHAAIKKLDDVWT